MAVRPCLDCGALSPGSRCQPCRANRYDRDHKRGRARWVPLVATGTVTCWRCHLPITGAWDLGHRPGDSHPEHTHCNRGAAATGLAG